ncbi:ribosome biogenesis protein Rrp14-C [Phyllosticta capitalensis]|uniref:Ribosome biogenesis protein Rrp14-C n=1 Tax=Phyllosticta capitalensis TaxID=121624 RepID=A0ABR1YF33_9PEZI
MADDLEARLKSHAQAFEGLMSLIPAKNYYGEDTSDQWCRKKQTKAQKKAAKKAKLDPDNIQTAKDVMDENERKRKRQLEGADDDDLSESDMSGKEQPHQGLKLKESKRQKLEKAARQHGKEDEVEDDEEAQRKREERQKQIQERREKKKQKQKEKAEAKKAAREQAASVDAPNPESEESAEDTPKPTVEKDESADEASDADSGDDEVEAMDISGLVDEEDNDDASDSDSESDASASAEAESPASSAVPSASSSSSIVPPADKADKSQQADKSQKSSKLKLPDVDQEVLQERLKARIEALRAARKADGIDGKPARNRGELLEARRRKEEERRQRKKEVRKQAKEDEQRKKAEAELARLRGSGSPGTPDIFSPAEENNFSFGRIAFDDGQQTDLSGTNLIDLSHKKGRMDPKTALIHAEKKKERLASMDEDKRKEIEEKERWLSAKKKVHGEKVRDDTNLLKKTLKRKDKQKKKSEKEWTERKEGVEKSIAARQKKREDNLQKRREIKGTKPGKKANRAKAAAGKKKSRPGFEGSFRSKAK